MVVWHDSCGGNTEKEEKISYKIVVGVYDVRLSSSCVYVWMPETPIVGLCDGEVDARARRDWDG